MATRTTMMCRMIQQAKPSIPRRIGKSRRHLDTPPFLSVECVALTSDLLILMLVNSVQRGDKSLGGQSGMSADRPPPPRWTQMNEKAARVPKGNSKTDLGIGGVGVRIGNSYLRENGSGDWEEITPPPTDGREGGMTRSASGEIGISRYSLAGNGNNGVKSSIGYNEPSPERRTEDTFFSSSPD
mmetsp:Transcript_4496/g.16140  ORF Transcript_4496/g.16140 Transcript_4496/m.16140 type:complete len:184 (-) Transcript_4496:126-677(-)